MNSEKGFTLVELLVVVAIITILAALLLPTLDNAMLMSKITPLLIAVLLFGQGPWLYSNPANNNRLFH